MSPFLWARNEDPIKRWIEYSMAKDKMFEHMNIKQAPEYVLNSDNKERARLNCINHLLSMTTMDI